MKIIRSETSNNQQISKKKVLDNISEDDDLEKLIYTIIDACPYDFESIPAIASFKYLSFYDQITQLNEIRYFSKMYELINLLCVYKKLIQKLENDKLTQNTKTSELSSSKNLQRDVCLNEEDLFISCQICAIKIYKSYSFGENNTFIDNKKLAFCLNSILNEFFEESFTSRLKENDITKISKKKIKFGGLDIYDFV